LAGVIELVLHEAVEHVIEGVVSSLFAGDRVVEAGVGKSGDCGDEFFMDALHVAESCAPGGGARVGDGRKILGIGEGHGVSGEAAENGAVPGGDVEHEFPDAVGRAAACAAVTP
jgi:hypothetical protein